MAVYIKPSLPHVDLAALMASRGLDVPDKPRLIRHIKHVSYYRLSGYAKNFQDSASNFIPGTTYDHVWDLYKFDRKLRLLTLDAIERIEVSVRTVFSDVMSQTHGPFWYMVPAIFSKATACSEFCSAIATETSKNNPKNRSRPTAHYYAAYASPALPPSWMVMECLTMGKWTRAYSSLKTSEQNRLSNEYGIPALLMQSWISSLAWTRNVCAHHGILWDRTIARPPKVPSPIGVFCPDFTAQRTIYYASACLIYFLLKKIVRKSTWSNRLHSLFQEFGYVDTRKMGFPLDWIDDPFWEIEDQQEFFLP